MAGGAIGIKLSPLWYVIDSCPMIRAPPNGSGTEKKKKFKIPPKKKPEITSQYFILTFFLPAISMHASVSTLSCFHGPF